MLTISKTEIQQQGGFLCALANKSCRYIRDVFSSQGINSLGGKDTDLENLIVHAAPHLDEYFAELMFRACLPEDKQKCPFLEQALYSLTNDLASQQLWPTAAVFGIGRTVGGGVLPLFLFDEHVADAHTGRTRAAASCSQLVINKLVKRSPSSIQTLLQEVNAIDEFGKAHEQSLANLIKVLHEARFVFRLDSTNTPVSDFLTPEWKKAILNASIAAVVYCLEQKIDLVGNPNQKKAALFRSLEKYAQNSPHRNNPWFEKAIQFMRSTYGDQEKVFSEAVIRNAKGPILDANGNVMPQLMILSRVCFACEQCWDEKIHSIITTHFWEAAMLGQLNFYPVEQAITEMFDKNLNRLTRAVGTLRREILPPVTAKNGRKVPLWIIAVSPESTVFLPNKAAMSFINDQNSAGKDKDGRKLGCGLVLIQDTYRGTSALMKGSGIPDEKWELLVNMLKSKEGACWHITRNSMGGFAPFVNNGNRAHQYVPRTRLDIKTLAQLVRHTFY